MTRDEAIKAVQKSFEKVKCDVVGSDIVVALEALGLLKLHEPLSA